jgi:hypothetical protein
MFEVASFFSPVPDLRARLPSPSNVFLIRTRVLCVCVCVCVCGCTGDEDSGLQMSLQQLLNLFYMTSLIFFFIRTSLDRKKFGILGQLAFLNIGRRTWEEDVGIHGLKQLKFR